MLEEYCVGTIDLAHVDRDVLSRVRSKEVVSMECDTCTKILTHDFLRGEDAVHDGDVLAAGILCHADDADPRFRFDEGRGEGFGGVESVDI